MTGIAARDSDGVVHWAGFITESARDHRLRQVKVQVEHLAPRCVDGRIGRDPLASTCVEDVTCLLCLMTTVNQ